MLHREKIFSICFTVLFSIGSWAQTKPDDKAFKLLDNALGKYFDDTNVGMNFEAIAFDLKDPRSIFTEPLYKVYKGGFFYMTGDKFEMHLASSKSLCDGKIILLVDERSKTVFVDSVRNSLLDTMQFDIAKYFEKEYGATAISYMGTEIVNGKNCHKIKTTVKGNTDTHSLFWIDVAKGTLLLMADLDTKGYTTYWIKNIGKSPPNYQYTIYLPKKELDQFHGYSVVDNRFLYSEFHKKNIK